MRGEWRIVPNEMPKLLTRSKTRRSDIASVISSRACLFRGIYFPQMNKRAWLKLIFQEPHPDSESHERGYRYVALFPKE